MRRRRRRRCSSRTAAEGRRPWGGRRAGRERRGRGRDCDRGCDCGTAAAALPPRRESASGSREGRGGHVGEGLAALPGLTVPAGESRGRRGAPAGPGRSVYCLSSHSPFRHGMARPGPAAAPPLPWQRRRIAALRLRAARPTAFLNPLRARWRLVSPGRALIGRAGRSPPRVDWVGAGRWGGFCALIGRRGRGPAGAAEGAGAGGTRRERRCRSWSPRCHRRRSSLTAAARPSRGLQRSNPASGTGRRGEGRVAALPVPRSARPGSEVPAGRREGPHRPSPAGHTAPGAPCAGLWG